MRVRAIFSVLASLGLAASTAVPADAAPGPDVEHARVILSMSTNADWSTVELAGVEFLDHRVVWGNPGVDANRPAVYAPAGALGSARGFAVELLVTVPADADVQLTVTKGGGGSVSTATLERVAASGERTRIGRVTSGESLDGTNAVAVPIDRAALVAAPLDLGRTDPERLAIVMVHPWWTGQEAAAFTPAQPQGAWDYSSAAAVQAQVKAIGDLGTDVIAFSFGWPDDLAGDPMIERLVDAVVADGRMRLMPLIELDAASNAPATVDRQIDRAWDLVRAHLDRFVWRRTTGGVEAPVFFFYGDQGLAPGVWNDIVQRAADRRNPVFSIGTVTTDDRRLDARYVYNVGNVDGPLLRGLALEQWFRTRVAPILRKPNHRSPVTVATVSPGYDDRSQPRGAAGLVRPRDGGRRYTATWEAALAGDPDWVFISTWNEWWEQTQIAPDSVSGRVAYDQTAAWISAFHGAAPGASCGVACGPAAGTIAPTGSPSAPAEGTQPTTTEPSGAAAADEVSAAEALANGAEGSLAGPAAPRIAAAAADRPASAERVGGWLAGGAGSLLALVVVALAMTVRARRRSGAGDAGPPSQLSAPPRS